MKRLIKMLITLIKKIRYTRNCRINILSVVIGDCRFEGENKIGAHTRFYHSNMGYGSNMGDNNLFRDTKIGRYCSIGSNVRLVSSSHPSKNVISTHPAFYSTKYNSLSYVSRIYFDETLKTENGNCLEVGHDVWIGDNVLIKGGVTIGNGAIVAMGSVVTKSIPPYAIVGGVPAGVIRYRFDEDQIQQLEALAWWEKPINWIKENASRFNDADSFLKEIGRE